MPVDIDQIIAGGAGASSRADFSGLGDLPKAYWEGQDQKAKNDLRDAFKGGLPMKDGQVDWPTVTQKFFSVGAIEQGLTAANQDLAQQNMRFGQGQSNSIQNFENGGQAAQQSTIKSPPSTSSQRLETVAAPLNKGGVQGQARPQGDQPGSIVGHISAAGIPDELAGPVIQQVSAMTKTDPNATLSPEMSQRVQQVIQAAALRIKGGQQPQPTGLAPSPQAQMAPVVPPQPPQGQPAPVTNPLTTTQAPATPSRVDQGIALYAGMMSDPRSPKQNVELAKTRLEALQKSNELTPDQKNYVQYKLEGGKGTMQEYQVALAGQKSAAEEQAKLTGPQRELAQARKEGFKGTLEDWQNRTDDNTTQRDILTKSTIPRLDESQKKATAARDDIDTLHKARAEIDRPDGIFSGAFAGDKLKLAKAAEMFGLSNPDKIANTEAFSSAAGQRVASLIKAFGSGTAISDGDRKFTEAIAGGRITLDEKSIRRILDIGEKADRLIIERHNEFADKAVKSNEGLKSARDTYIVEHPGQYKKQEAPSFPKFNSASDVQSAIASKKLKSGDGFLTSDGRTKYVP